MANGPDAFYLDKLRKLQGSPSATSPASNAGSLKVERVQTLSKSATLPAYGSADPDATYAAAGARLTVRNVTGSDNLNQEVYTCYEALGAREQQDLWNEQPATYPYGSLLFPRTTRKYRFFFDQVPAFAIGQTTDTQKTDATLVNLQEADESAVVKTFTAFFDDVPTTVQQAALGSGANGLGISVTFPEGDHAFPTVKWSFLILNKFYVPAENNETCPLPGYTTLMLTDQERTPSPDQPLEAIQTNTYEILPGKIISSSDAARLPRTLTPIPAYYLNGDLITTTFQKVPYAVNNVLTIADTLTNTLLSSKVEAKSSLFAVKTNISRANAALPLIYLPKKLGEYGGSAGQTYKMVVAISDTGNVVSNQSNLTTAINSAVFLLNSMGQNQEDAFNIIEYETTPLSPIQVEISYTVVYSFPSLFSVESSVPIPKKFLDLFNLDTHVTWVETINSEPADYLSADYSENGLLVSCRVEAETAERAKRTATLLPAGSLPVSLVSGEEIDGMLATITETLSNVPQSITLTALMLEGSGITDLGGGISLKTVKSVSSYPKLIGREYDEKLGVTSGYTTQTMSVADAATAGAGDAIELRPKDALRTEVIDKSVDAAAAAKLSTYVRVVVGMISRLSDIPDVLLELAMEWEVAGGVGANTSTGRSVAFGQSGHLEIDASNSAQASSVIIPSVRPRIYTPNVSNRPCLDVFFFIETANASSYGAVINHLTSLAGVPATILPWPVWQMIAETLVGKGEKLSVRANASSRASLAFSADGISQGLSHGNGYDQDWSSTVRDFNIKPTIHGPIRVGEVNNGGTSTTFGIGTDGITVQGPAGGGAQSFSDTVTAQTVEVTASADATVTAYCGDARTVTLKAKASVSPQFLHATPGQNTIPSSGVYLYDLHLDFYRPGWCIGRARLFDFANLTADAGGTGLGTGAGTVVVTAPATGNDTLAGTGGGGFFTSPSDGTGAGTGTGTGTSTGTGTGAGGSSGGSSASSPVVTTNLPATYSIPNGTNAALHLSVAAMGDDSDCVFYKNGVAYSDGFNLDVSGPNLDGDYYAIISNALGSVQTNTCVATYDTTSDDPKLVSPLTATYDKVARTVTLSVVGSGTPPVTYAFQRRYPTAPNYVTLINASGTVNNSNQKNQYIDTVPLSVPDGTVISYQVIIKSASGNDETSTSATTVTIGQPPAVVTYVLAFDPALQGATIFGNSSSGYLPVAIKLRLSAPAPTDTTITVGKAAYGTFLDNRYQPIARPAVEVTIPAGQLIVPSRAQDVIYYQAAAGDVTHGGGFVTLSAVGTITNGPTVQAQTTLVIGQF